MSRHIKAMDAYVWVYMKQKTAMVRITKPNTIVLLYPNTGDSNPDNRRIIV